MNGGKKYLKSLRIFGKSKPYNKINKYEKIELLGHISEVKQKKKNKNIINIKQHLRKKNYFNKLKSNKINLGKKIINRNSLKRSFILKTSILFILLAIFISTSFYLKENQIPDGSIRVGYYVFSMRNGGIERVFSSLIRHLSKVKKFSFYLITRIATGGEYPIPKSTKRIILLWRRMSLIEALEKEHIDILIYNYEDKLAEELIKLKKTKVIFYNHSSFLYWIYQSRIYNFENSIYNVYKNCKYVISLIPLENDYLLKKWGINSVLMDNPSTFEYDEVIPSDLSSKNIIMIGRNDPVKRQHLGIIAMETIIKEIPECQLDIVSAANGGLNKLIKKLNLENNVRFTGYQQKVEKYLKNASLSLFTSENESYLIALAEVKIFGIPSIICGLDFLTLAKGGTVIIYDDDPVTIAKESIKILKDDEYRKRLGKEARESMKERKNELIAQRWVKLLLSVYKGDEKVYQKLAVSDYHDKVSEKEAEQILKNQLLLLQKRRSRFKNLTLEKLKNYSLS